MQEPAFSPADRYNLLSHWQEHWLKINSLCLMTPSRCPSAGAGPEGTLHGDSPRPALPYQHAAGHSGGHSSSIRLCHCLFHRMVDFLFCLLLQKLLLRNAFVIFSWH